MRQPDVVRVGLRLRRAPARRVAGQLIGPREHDPPVHGLDRPAVGDEPAGQAVEQLGMRGRLAAACRSRWACATRPAAEMVLPDAVDHHPGRQRVLRVGQPARPARSRPLPLSPAGRSLAAEDGQEPARHLRRRGSSDRPGAGRGRWPACRTRPWRRRSAGAVRSRRAQRHEVARPLRLLRAGERVARAGEDAVEGVVVVAARSGRTCGRGSGRRRASGRAPPCPACRSCPRWSGDGSSAGRSRTGGRRPGSRWR